MSTKPNEMTGGGEPAAREIRYSLPELLAELEVERSAAAFAREKLSQVEINRMFAKKPRSHGRSKK